MSVRCELCTGAQPMRNILMKRLLAILAIAATGLIAACGQGSTSSGTIAPAVSVEAPSTGASAPAESMAPEESAS